MNELLTVAHEYSLKWRFHFNIDKCISLVYGKDLLPSRPVTIGDTKISITASCRHMGIKLFTDIASRQDMLSERIGAGRSVVFAARGLGVAGFQPTLRCYRSCIGQLPFQKCCMVLKLPILVKTW